MRRALSLRRFQIFHLDPKNNKKKNDQKKTNKKTAQETKEFVTTVTVITAKLVGAAANQERSVTTSGKKKKENRKWDDVAAFKLLSQSKMNRDLLEFFYFLTFGSLTPTSNNLSSKESSQEALKVSWRFKNGGRKLTRRLYLCVFFTSTEAFIFSPLSGY